MTKATPWSYVQDEITERGWTVEQFAVNASLSVQEARDFLAGQTPITLWLATQLSRMFGTSVYLWLNLQRAYDATGGKC